MTPDLQGQAIVAARLGYMLRLFTSSDWQVDIETDVVVTRSSFDPTLIRMDVPDAELPEYLSWLIGSTITEVAVADNGDLTIVLNGGQLTAATLSDYEAWQMYGPKGEIIVCGPGGRFTEWGPLNE